MIKLSDCTLAFTSRVLSVTFEKVMAVTEENLSYIQSNNQSTMLLNISLITFEQLALNNNIKGNRINQKKKMK